MTVRLTLARGRVAHELARAVPIDGTPIRPRLRAVEREALACLNTTHGPWRRVLRRERA